MSKSETLKTEKTSWVTFCLAFVILPFATYLGDVILVCIAYGSDGYFKQGLRIIKHNPLTVSNGAKISPGLGLLGWAIVVFIWISVVFLAKGLLRLFAHCRLSAKSRQ